MRENFSKGIRKILKLAKEEAVRLAHSYDITEQKTAEEA